LGGARRVEGSDGEIEVFESSVFVVEVAVTANDATQFGVEVLDRVSGVNDFADVGAVAEEGDELGPDVLPKPDNRRIAIAPLGGELIEALAGGLFGGSGIDRLDVASGFGLVGRRR
jgi:hypothetical protein